MKTIFKIAILAFVAIFTIEGLLTVGVMYSRNNVYGEWLEVRNQYKRQIDLIPNMVTITRKYLEYEFNTFLKVVEARAELFREASTTNDMGAIVGAGEQLTTSIFNFKIQVEAYPELKADQIIENLMVVVEGTQNRITRARHRYNDALVSYNNGLILAPLARLFGYSEMRGLEFLEVPEEYTIPDEDLSIDW